ncbi:MAG: UDP-N-acetylglucosamine--N-acetylmuramyl-(pentapeptide) pyrophosphoryl-undecaprenol N-acetylglucosamine transferase [Corallococcus sp.]|nr:UDP-N-acetylglucosamine--N-acetylmuramyl-(pentapeptide) pyrophosphoryl-undecaprenol N-acetylglucosamine transferase [Bacillota bacterium]MCM1533674.1 UDP-N-acetylglucosamine--N-acetylmuramyl-(pentapeptide) pyrophosphoryl-undecaprenol N-acetylglucosamine transferase [Corallococcus sp.]
MKIVFSGGGTAGHVTPNLALMDKLQNETLYYVGSNGMEKDLLIPYVEHGKVAEYREITANKLRRKFTLKNLALPFQLIKSVNQAKKHLADIRPDVVFSKGGYVGLPVIIAAKKLKIPSVIHESDMSLGLANRISALYATKLLTAFPCSKKAETVGLIIREEIKLGNKAKGLSLMGFDGKKPVLLVTGGSLGANALNEAIRRNREMSEIFDIFVITGKGKKIDCDFLNQAEFVSDMGDIFAAADVCLTRAGSTSLAELTLTSTPFVTVPLTKCSRGEQVKNAEWFVNRGCGISVREDELSKKLPQAVKFVYDNRSVIQTKQRKVSDEIYGTDKVAETILKMRKESN